MADFKLKYADIKASISVNREKKVALELIDGINADSCGLTSLVSSDCNPKIDIGDQFVSVEEFPKMEVEWAE